MSARSSIVGPHVNPTPDMVMVTQWRRFKRELIAQGFTR